MQRAILFRFHSQPRICRNRLELLRTFNPDVPMYGLYGGPEKNYATFEEQLSPHLRDIRQFPDRDANWKWKNGDLAVRLWYRSFGHTLAFDMLHLVEWDLLLLDSLDNLYGRIPVNGVGMTSVTRVEDIERQLLWVSQEPFRSQWKELLRIARDLHGYSGAPLAGQGPGLCLPRPFLDCFADVDVPDLVNDEVRIPLFARILGFELFDTGFSNGWFSADELQFFHCQLFPEVKPSTVYQQLADPAGRRAFHPFRRTLFLDPSERRKHRFIAMTDAAGQLRKQFSHYARRLLA